MKYDDKTLLANDPYDLADEPDVRLRKTKIVQTRKQQVCVPPLDDVHDIPAGTRAFFESAFVSGLPTTNYVCEHHMNQYIEEMRELPSAKADGF